MSRLSIGMRVKVDYHWKGSCFHNQIGHITNIVREGDRRNVIIIDFDPPLNGGYGFYEEIVMPYTATPEEEAIYQERQLKVEDQKRRQQHAEKYL